MLEYPKALLVSYEGETNLLHPVLNEHVILTCVRNPTELYGLLESGGYDALFCDESIDTGVWNVALAEVRQGYPDLPMIILSQRDGAQDWADALEAGAFDLLVAPHLKRAGSAVWEQAVGFHGARTTRNNGERLIREKAVCQARRA